MNPLRTFIRYGRYKTTFQVHQLKNFQVKISILHLNVRSTSVITVHSVSTDNNHVDPCSQNFDIPTRNCNGQSWILAAEKSNRHVIEFATTIITRIRITFGCRYEARSRVTVTHTCRQRDEYNEFDGRLKTITSMYWFSTTDPKVSGRTKRLNRTGLLSPFPLSLAVF